MAIERGIKKYTRKRAQNFIQDIAQKRLEETVEPLNSKSRNSLDVNYHESIIYTSAGFGPVCTCEETQVHQENTVETANTNIPSGVASKKGENVFTIDRNYNLFGEQNQYQSTDDEIDLDDRVGKILKDEEPLNIIDNILAGANEDCGICYSKGKVPGYIPYMWQRELFESHSMLDSEGFWLDTTTSPHTFKKQSKKGFVEFGLSVPKYWKKCLVSIRNNRELLKDPFYVGSHILTRAMLDASRGKPLTIQVKAKEWTHAILAFDLGVPIRVNVSEITQAKDYTLFEYYSSLNVIIPPEVAKINVSDVIVLPKFNVVLKISDISRKRTSQLTKYAEWSAQSRILQPQEALRHIHDGNVL